MYIIKYKDHGVQRQTVPTCSFSKRTILNDLNVNSARRNIVWIVGWNGIGIWHASNIRWVLLWVNKIRNFLNLLGEKNLNSVQNVNFGLRRTMVAIIWLVNVNLSFVINVGEFIWNVSVWKSLEGSRKGGELNWRKGEGRKLRQKSRQPKNPVTAGGSRSRGGSKSWDGRGMIDLTDRGEENDWIEKYIN